MINTKTLDAKFLTTLVGAGFGASALEGDGDLTGATIGLGVGAFAGSNVKVTLPKFEKFVQKNQIIKINNRPESEIEKLRQELKTKLKSSSEGFDFLPDNDIDFDKKDPFKTLTNKNIRSVIDDTTNLSELKTIANIVKHENNIEKVDTKVITDTFRARDDITRATQNTSVETKVDLLNRYFSDMGYKGEELKNKTELFSGNLKKETSLVINRNTNTVSIGSNNFRVSSNFSGDGGVSSHVNNDNYSAVRKLNPFADMYLQSEGKIQGRAIAQALGINFADAAKEEAIGKQIEEFARKGAKPEDLKALLMQSPEFTQKDVDRIIGKSYQHMERESGLRAMGYSQGTIEDSATDLAKNISKQTSSHNVFNLDSDGVIKTKKPFRSFSSNATSTLGSESHRFEKMIAKDLNIPNPRQGIKAGHTNLMNLYGGDSDLNALAPSERSQSTTGSRENPIQANKNSKNKVVQAMGVLKDRGLVPREYSTSSAVSRITTDKDAFNLVAKHLYPEMTSSLSDGASIGKASIRKDYAHSSYKKYDIFSADVGNIAISKEIKDHVTARTNLGISFDAPEIKSKRYSQLISKLGRVEAEQEAISEAIASNPSKVNLKALDRNKVKQKNLKASIELGQRSARKEIEATLRNLDPNSGNGKALTSILSAMNSGTKEGAAKLDEYSRVANKKFRANTLIGIDPNGAEVRLSNEFDDHKLVKSFRSVDMNSDSKASFVFRGIKNTGVDEIVKDFGVSGKVVVSNVKDSDFDKGYGIAKTLNKTGYKPVEELGILKFETGLVDSNGVKELKTGAEIKKLMDIEAAKAKSSGVGMITDLGDAGQKLSTEIYNNLNEGKDLTSIKTLPESLQTKLQSLVVDNIDSDVRKLALDSEEDITKAIRGRNWAAGQLATSLTEGKATSESVMGLRLLGQKNLSNLIDTIEIDPKFNGKESQYAVSLLSEVFGGDMVLNSLGDLDGLRSNTLNSYLDKVVKVSAMYSADNLGKSVATDAIFGKEVRDVFNLSYLSEGESTHIASSDIDTIMRLGSGSREKSLSHSAQLHLKMTAGFTDADFATMGQQNSKAVYDLKFSSELGKPMDKAITINSFLDTKTPEYKSDFLKTIGRLEPEKIDQFLITENVPEQIRNQDFLYYGVENKNSQNIITIPIHKYETTRVGSYVLPNGKEVFKGLQGEVRDLIAMDQNLSSSKLGSKDIFEESVIKLSSTVKDTFISGNNPQMKSTLALEVPNSMYGLSRQTNNKEFDDVFKRYASRGESVIGASRETAVEFLKGQGLDVDLSNLNDFISDEGLLKTQLTDGSLKESIFLQNREPAQSANSVRSTFMFVMDDQYSTKDGKSFVYHSSEDKHYVELMYGDQDGDNTTVYSDKRQLTPEEYASKKLRSDTSAINRNSLIELNEVLKIKGKSDKNVPLYSMDSLIQETRSNLDTLGFADNSPEFYNHLATKQKERMLQGTIKGSAVKTVSPGVTQLAMGLAESAFQMQSYKGAPITQMEREFMGTLGHGLVENLLKTKHTDTKVFADVVQLPVEALIQARGNFAKSDTRDTYSAYSNLFQKQFKDMIPDDETRKLYQPDIDRLFQADVENIKDPRKNPSNTMHVAKNATRITEGGVDVLSEVIDDIATSRNTTNISQLATEEVSTNIERSLKVGYNELLANSKQNLIRNKFPLILGAGGLALGALVTQKDPNFQPSKKARADTGNMMLAPNVVSQEQSKQSDPMILQNLGRVATDFVGPETSLQDISHSVKQTVKIQGSYQHFEKEMSDNMKEAIFGNNISNVRIEREYD